MNREKISIEELKNIYDLILLSEILKTKVKPIVNKRMSFLNTMSISITI
jgi:hypothetical protein